MAKRNPNARVPAAPDNALARKALDAIRDIDSEADQKKLAQLELLKTARTTIMERLKEFNHQVEQIDKAMEAITGQAAPSGEKAGRRNMHEIRERVAQWMEGHLGQKFNSADLVSEFSELEGVQISYLLKPLVESGKVRTDASGGAKRLKYFMPAG